MKQAGRLASCPWLLVDGDALRTVTEDIDMRQWAVQDFMNRPADKDEDVLLYRRLPTTGH
jgi:hypothetical protein